MSAVSTVTSSSAAAAPFSGASSAPRFDLITDVIREMENVQTTILEQIEGRSPLVEQVIRHTLSGGGKRLRPAFILLSARAVQSEIPVERLYRLGACMEMIHMATLVHDDVVDNSDTRRGRPTAARTFGNTASILSGDVLLARAMTILAEDGDISIIGTVSDAMVQMAEGEVRELELRGDFDLDEASHLEVLTMKTAAFIRCCCEIGAKAVRGEEAHVRALSRYGEKVGLAFQIVDDLLDYRGDPKQTGKPLATDFREGQATLPLIFLREKMTANEAEIARRRFGGEVDEAEIRLVCEWMDTRGSFDRAERMAKELIASAEADLAVLPPSPAVDALHAIAQYVLVRQV